MTNPLKLSNGQITEFSGTDAPSFTGLWTASAAFGDDDSSPSGIPDQSSIGGPTLTTGKLIFNTASGKIWSVASGSWTLVHTISIDEMVLCTWGSYTGAFAYYSGGLWYGRASGSEPKLVGEATAAYLDAYLTLASLANVVSTTPATGDVLTFDGSTWGPDRADGMALAVLAVFDDDDTTPPSGTLDQSSIGGPTLTSGDVLNSGSGKIWTVAAGTWTLKHTITVGEFVVCSYYGYSDKSTSLSGWIGTATGPQPISGGTFEAFNDFLQTQVLDDLANVNTSGLVTNDVLTFDGTNWVAEAPSGGGGGSAADSDQAIIAAGVFS